MWFSQEEFCPPLPRGHCESLRYIWWSWPQGGYHCRHYIKKNKHLSFCDVFVHMSVFLLDYNFTESQRLMKHTGRFKLTETTFASSSRLHAWFLWPRMPEQWGSHPEQKQMKLFFSSFPWCPKHLRGWGAWCGPSLILLYLGLASLFRSICK